MQYNVVHTVIFEHREPQSIKDNVNCISWTYVAIPLSVSIGSLLFPTGTLHIMLKICSELLVYSKISFALMLVNSHVRARPFNASTPFSIFEPILSPPSAAAAHWSDISLDSKAAIPPQAKNFKHSISQSTGRGGEILTRHKRVPQGEDTWYTMLQVPMQWTWS